MTEKEYKDWRIGHCRRACVNHAEYVAMLEEWKKQFLKMEATVQELEAASEWFVAEWMPQHVNAQWGCHPGILRKRIFEERNRIKQRAAYQELLKDGKPLTFAAEGHRAKVEEALRGIGRPGEAKDLK